MTRCSNIRFHMPGSSQSRPEMVDWTIAISCSMGAGYCLWPPTGIGFLNLRSIDAEQASHQVGELGHDAVELLGHPQPEHRVHVDGVDAGEEDVSPEEARAEVGEPDRLPGLVDEGHRLADAQVALAPVGGVEVEVLRRHQREG